MGSKFNLGLSQFRVECSDFDCGEDGAGDREELSVELGFLDGTSVPPERPGDPREGGMQVLPVLPGRPLPVNPAGDQGSFVQ